MEGAIFIEGVDSNRVAGWITAVEYLLGTIAVLSLRPAVSALWLYWLHRRKAVPVMVGNRFHMGWKKEFLGILLGFGFAAAAFSVERRLVTGYDVRGTLGRSVYCAEMGRPSGYAAFLMDDRGTLPPGTFAVDAASVAIARSAACDHGIDRLDFGTNVSDDTLLAPSCRAQPAPPIKPFTFGESFEIINRADGIEPRVERHIHYYSPMAFVIPHNVSVELATFASPAEGSDLIVPACAAAGLSSVVSASHFAWAVREASSDKVSRVLLGELCEAHAAAGRSNVGIGAFGADGNADELRALLAECQLTDNEYSFSPTCIREFATKNSLPLYTTTLPSASLLHMGESGDDGYATATACPDVALDYEYATLSLQFLSRLGRGLFDAPAGGAADEPVLVPTRLTVRPGGHCEPVMHALGLGALYYTARSTWTGAANRGANLIDPSQGIGRDLLALNGKQRYHAYLISLARLHFPFEQLRLSAANGTCELWVTSEGTKIPLDSYFWFMTAISAASVVLIVAALVLRRAVPQHAWNLATYTETLSALKLNRADVSVDGMHDSSIARFINDHARDGFAAGRGAGASGGGGGGGALDSIRSFAGFNLQGWTSNGGSANVSGGTTSTADGRPRNPSIVIYAHDENERLINSGADGSAPTGAGATADGQNTAETSNGFAPSSPARSGGGGRRPSKRFSYSIRKLPDVSQTFGDGGGGGV